MRNIILISVLILLGGFAYYIVNKDKSKTEELLKADRGFTVESMDMINKMVIKHPRLQPLVFVRDGKSWTLNDKVPVDEYVFAQMEKVLTEMRMKYVPSKKASATIMKSLATDGIQVDLYGNDLSTPFKIIHIGTDAPNGNGTFMVLGGETQPYAMNLPALDGGLRSRFEQPVYNYRQRFIYRIPAAQIKTIRVDYPMQTTSSFLLVNDGDVPTIKSLSNNDAPSTKTIIPRIAKSYLSTFEELGIESVVTGLEFNDKVKKYEPFCIITIDKKDGTQVKYNYFSYDEIEDGGEKVLGVKDGAKQNRYYITNAEGELFTAQIRVFKGVITGLDDFYK